MTNQEIDEYLAVEVMKYPPGDTESLGGIILKQRFDNFHPTENLNQAFMVVDKMRELGFKQFTLNYNPYLNSHKGAYSVYLAKSVNVMGTAYSADPAEAISRAAVAAHKPGI